MTTLPSEVKAALREKLAAIEHERWADWQAWCHKVLRENCPSPELEKVLERWDRQIATPYDKLSEAEKQSDRDQVDRYWHILQPEIERLVVNAEERGYRLGSQITLQDLLLSLPSELSTPKALKLLKEYTALLKTYADIKRRHDSVANGLLKDVADMHTSLTHPKQQEEKQ